MKLKFILLLFLFLAPAAFAQSAAKDTTNTHGDRIDTNTERTAFRSALMLGTAATTDSTAYDVAGAAAAAQAAAIAASDPVGSAAAAQAFAIQRANHTGTQSYTTITGLGTAATTNSTAYATAAQGALADTALQAAALTPYATLASPTFTGTVVLPSTTSIGTVSSTELGYLDGVTSALQTQLNAKLNRSGGNLTGNLFSTHMFQTTGVDADIWTIGANADIGTVGAGSTIYTEGANANIYTADPTAYIESASTFKLNTGTFKTTIGHPAITANQAINFPDTAGVGGTVALTSDLAPYAPLASPTFTGTVVLPSFTSIGNVSATELGYLDGVTSALQTQLNGKAPSLGGDDNYVTDAEKIVIGNTSGTNTGDNAVNSLYSGLVTNATHTGDATGATALSVVRIQGTPIAAPVAGDDGKVIKYDHGTTSFVYQSLAGGGDLLAANNLSDLANAATARTNLGLAIGTDVQAYSAILAGTTASFLTAQETKLGHLSVTQAVNLDTMESDIATNNAKVTNATHTGDATGSGALTVVAINGTNLASLGTGLLKNTTGTGVPSIAVAGTDYLTPTGSAAGLTSFPTLNQNTTGSAATLTTPRNINGVAFNGSADITVTAAAGTLSGTTLNATVTGSSLTSLGTINTGVWQGTAIADSYISSAATWNAKQSAITFGTGVQTALGVNIGVAGAPVLFDGAGGTPSSLTLTNATGLPISTGVSGLGTGVATLLATPSSANLRSAITDETGTGVAVFNDTPTLTNPTVTNFTESVVAIGNTGTSQTIALTNGTVQTATLTGNCTFTMPTATAGKSFTLFLKSGAGGFTSTFTGVNWSGGITPTITTTASRLDIISFISDGTNWYGSIIQNFTH